jgi:hypothetical protein
LTTTIREELARLASSIEDALADQSRVEEVLAGEFKAIDSFIKSLDNKRGNKALTVEEARDLTVQLRQAMRWHEVNAHQTHLLLLLVLQLSLLIQQDPELKLDAAKNMEELGRWVEQWETAASAWNKYTE